MENVNLRFLFPVIIACVLNQSSENITKDFETLICWIYEFDIKFLLFRKDLYKFELNKKGFYKCLQES